MENVESKVLLLVRRAWHIRVKLPCIYKLNTQGGTLQARATRQIHAASGPGETSADLFDWEGDEMMVWRPSAERLAEVRHDGELHSIS